MGGRGLGGGITEHNLASVKSTSELLTKPGAPCYVANNMEVCVANGMVVPNAQSKKCCQLLIDLGSLKAGLFSKPGAPCYAANNIEVCVCGQ